MLSGVSAKIAVKVFGNDLVELRTIGMQIEKIARDIPGLTDVNLEAQVPIPQLKIEVNRERARAYGVQPGALNEQLSPLLGGKTLAELREGPRTLDLVLRLAVGLLLLAFYHPLLLAFDVVLVVSLALILFVLGGGAVPSAVKESKKKV
jgi:Cu/Ag efflux pump CusA